jgi:hypothetical protein
MKFTPAVAVLAATAIFANTAAAATVKVPEGTEFRMRLEDKLSSKTSVDGDRFTVTLMEDVPLPDGTVLHSGYRGVGEVVNAEKSGRVGKKGQLNVRLNYVTVGGERIRLRASKGAEGSGNTGNMVAAIVLVGVFGLLVKGKSAEIPKGTQITGFSDSDTELTTPVPAPPPEV